MPKKRCKNMIFFSNGSIGDFLMTIFFFENVRKNEGDDLNYYIVVPRGKKFLNGFLEKYSYIELVDLNKKNLFGIFYFVFSKILNINTVVVHHTYGKIPMSVKFIAKMLAFAPKSKLYGFWDKGSSFINKIIFNKLIKFNTKKSYISNLSFMLEAMGFKMIQKKPEFFFETSPEILKEFDLSENNYLVLHSFAASRGRSLPNLRWKKIIEFLILETDLNIVITGAGKDEENINHILPEEINENRIKKALNLSVPEIAGLIINSKFYLGVDTGITHLACFLRHSSIVIGHLSNPSWLPYYNPNAKILFNKENCTCNGDKTGNCRVYEDGVGYLRCMYDIPQPEIENNIIIYLKR